MRSPGEAGDWCRGEAIRIKTVDFHIHVYPPEVIWDAESLSLREPYFNALTHNRVHRWATLEDLLDRMERDDVERAVVGGFAFRSRARPSGAGRGRSSARSGSSIGPPRSAAARSTARGPRGRPRRCGPGVPAPSTRGRIAGSSRPERA